MSTSQPIPISTPPHQMSSHSPPATGPKDTPGSSVSMSPQTPFLPNQTLSSTAPNPNSGILQWARSFKSPPAQGGMTLPPAPAPGQGSPPTHQHQQQKGFDIPSIRADDHDHDHDEHDSFEFGDLSTRTWGRMGRRAVSMSVPSGQGISGMLSGFTPTSPPKHGGAEGLGVGSPPSQMSSSVLADKTARGQGVLRRLSISGGFAKPPMFSPPLPTTAPSGGQQQSNLTASAPPQDFGPPVADPVQRANTLGARGRRLSDSGGKKRGVSPMGERLLRDHGHF